MWSQIPEELLQPISASLLGVKAWSCWQAVQAPCDFLALRGACRRIAEGSARELKELDLTQKGSGTDLWSALGLLSEARYPSLHRLSVPVEDADGFRVLQEAVQVPQAKALHVRLVAKAALTASLAAISRPCRSIRGLRVVSSSHFDDSMLQELLRLCPTLQELDLRRSEALRRPKLSQLEGLRGLFLDGCWQLEDDAVEALASLHFSGRCVVDWFLGCGCAREEGQGPAVGGLGSQGSQGSQSGDALAQPWQPWQPWPWQLGQEVEVVILSEGYRGQWVAANVVSAAVFAGQSPEPCFNILVQKTEACSQAVGFSGRVAFRIRRRHLRHSTA